MSTANDINSIEAVWTFLALKALGRACSLFSGSGFLQRKCGLGSPILILIRLALSWLKSHCSPLYGSEQLQDLLPVVHVFGFSESLTMSLVLRIIIIGRSFGDGLTLLLSPLKNALSVRNPSPAPTDPLKYLKLKIVNAPRNIALHSR